MTTIPSDPPVAATRPVPRRRPTTTARRPSPLARTVEQAITRIDGVAAGLDHPARSALDRQLRAALSRHVAQTGEGAPAVRVACAHLAAGDLEWAYLALLTARDDLRT